METVNPGLIPFLCRWTLFLSLIFLVSSKSTTQAAAPDSLASLFPAGLQLGTRTNLQAEGKWESWPVKVWTDDPGLVLKAGEKKGEFSVEAKGRPGPHWIRAYNQDGVSEPRLIVVGHVPEQRETEPNNGLEQAQILASLPVVLNGRLKARGDVDTFALDLTAGQWLVVAMSAYDMDSPMDAILQLQDAKGHTLTANHDRAGTGLDPFLVYEVQDTGRHILQCAAFAYPPKAEVIYSGGDAAIYRLAIHHGPVIHHFFPLGVEAGQAATVEVHGWNLESSGRPVLHLKADDPRLAAQTFPARVSLHAFQSPSPAPLVISEHAEAKDEEPNQTVETAQPISIPITINGRIGHRGDIDRFAFKAVKGDVVEMRLESARLGFPVDATLQVANAGGKYLVAQDDAGKVPDPVVTWTSPADGDYQVAVKDRFGNGGTNHIYRLTLQKAAPRLTLALAQNALALKSGQTNALKLTLTRHHGDTNDYRIAVEGLPKGITCAPVEAPAKNGEVTLSLVTTKDVKGTSVPLQVVAHPPGRPTPRIMATATIKGKHAEAGDLLLNTVNHVWVTVGE